MHPRARDLPGREQAGHRRPAVQIGFHAAHQVVRGRPDGNRDRAPDRIRRCGTSRRSSETGGAHRPASRCRRLRKIGPAVRWDFEHDAAGDDIARRQIGRRMISRHERPSGSRRRAARPRRAALLKAGTAAHPPTSSTVGWNCTNSMSAMRAPARNASATPSPVATAGFVVSWNTWPAPPVASSVARPNTRPARASLVDETDAKAAAVLDDRAHRERVLEHANPRARRSAFPQHAADLTPGGVARREERAERCARPPMRAPGCPARRGRTARPIRSARACSAGPSSHSTRTARSSQRPSPAATVSLACSSGESSGPMAAAMPPCAYSVLLSLGSALVMTMMSPAGASSTAARRPAIPLPTMMKSPRTSTGRYTNACIGEWVTGD